ncbi:MAG: CapA family protein [Gemmatimonadota bacterium]
MTRSRYAVAARAIGAAIAVWTAACTARTTPPVTPVAPRDTVVIAPDSRPAPVPRDTTPPAPPPPIRAALPVRLTFTGDINLGTSTLPDGIPPDSGRGLLRQVDSLLTGNLVIGNFEGVLADTGTSTKCDLPPSRRRPPAGTIARRPNCYAFMTPTMLAPRLADAGFTHLNLANNHAQDLGLAGRMSTESTLRNLGLKVYGPQGEITIDTVRSGDRLTIIGVIGFTTYPFANNLLDIDASTAVVDSLKRLVDIVVVTFHGGAEGAGAQNVPVGPEYLGKEPRGDLRTWARAVIDAGASIVVGHGPHVLRGIEFYRGRPIAYSLGNFVTYRGFNLEGPLGITAIFRVELTGNGGFTTGHIHPLRQPPRLGPRPDPAGAAIGLMQRLSREDFGAGAARIAPDGTVSPP